MPTVDEVIVRLDARVAAYQADVLRAQQTFDRSMLATTAAARRTELATAASFRGIGRSFLAVAGIGAGIAAVSLIGRGSVRAADTVVESINQIRSALSARGLEGDVEKIRQRLIDLAVDTRSEFDATSLLFTRLLRSTDSIGGSVEDAVRATEILNKAFQSSGQTAGEAANAARQLAQGLSSGFLQGDELRSLRENAPVVAKAIADAFGVTIGGLKILGQEGRLTTDVVFPAILKGGAEIDRQFEVTTASIGKSFGQLGTRTSEFVGELGRVSGITESIAETFASWAAGIENATDALREMSAESVGGAASAAEAIERVLSGDVTGARGRGQLIDPDQIADAETRLVQLQEQIDKVVRQLEDARANQASQSFVARLQSSLSELLAEQQAIEAAARPARLRFSEEGLPLINDLQLVNAEVRRLQRTLNDTTLPRDVAAQLTNDLGRAQQAAGLLRQEIDNLGGVEQIRIAARVEQNELTERDILDLKIRLEELIGPVVFDIRARFENGEQTAEDIRFLRSLIPDRPELLQVVARFENGRQTQQDIADVVGLLRSMKGPLDDIPALARSAGNALVDQFGAVGQAIANALALLNRFTSAQEKAANAARVLTRQDINPRTGLPFDTTNILRSQGGVTVRGPSRRIDDEGRTLDASGKVIKDAVDGLGRPLDDIASQTEQVARYNAEVAAGIPRIGDGINSLPGGIAGSQRGDFDRVVGAINNIDIRTGGAEGEIGRGVAPERGTFSFGGASNSLVGASGSLGNIRDLQIAGVGRIAGFWRGLQNQFLVEDELKAEEEARIAEQMEKANAHLAGIETNTSSFEDRLIALSQNEARLARLGSALNPLAGSGGGSATTGSTGSGSRTVVVNQTISTGNNVDETEVRAIFRLAANDFARELETTRAFR